MALPALWIQEEKEKKKKRGEGGQDWLDPAGHHRGPGAGGSGGERC